MFQPFERLTHQYVERLIVLNKTYLVTQTYHRAISPGSAGGKIAIIVTDYEDLNMARGHLNAVRKDKFAAIVHLNNPEHVKTVDGMLQPGSKYEVYWAVVRSVAEVKKILNLKYKDHIRHYITKHTSWRIGSDKTITPNLETVFGELFLVMKYGGQVLRAKFGDIENS
ncbi:MAG: hypothetical protein V4722_27980 [Bacteroidota bacterium]